MKREFRFPHLLEMIVAMGVILALGSPVFSDDDSPALDDLAWMAGHWSAIVEGIVMEEAWFEPLGGVMLGIHRDVRPGSRAFFEYLRIEEREDGLVYVASPMGRGATDFPLATFDAQSVVFENPGHDFPQRIIYSREGDRLTAKAEAMVEGELRSEVWVWQLIK